jgi:hypothetical protein
LYETKGTKRTKGWVEDSPVCGELEGLLADVVLLALDGVLLVLEHVLHLPPPLHQLLENLDAKKIQSGVNKPKHMNDFNVRSGVWPGSPAAVFHRLLE